ncbi:dihydroorotate dehydrogenase [Algibacter lectus]|nr:dihydroorotate dehydrogenase [Algibacter lectus]
MYKQLLRPIFFSFDPEKIHHFTFSLVKFTSKIPGFKSIYRSLYVIENPKLERNVLG